MKYIDNIDLKFEDLDNYSLSIYRAIDGTTTKTPVCENMDDYMGYYYPMLSRKYNQYFMDKMKTALGREYEIVRKLIMKDIKEKTDNYIIVRFKGKIGEDNYMIYDSVASNEEIAAEIADYLAQQKYVVDKMIEFVDKTGKTIKYSPKGLEK